MNAAEKVAEKILLMFSLLFEENNNKKKIHLEEITRKRQEK